MRKKNKNKKINNIVIKSFIVIAVVIMLLSAMPGEASQINEKNKNSLDKEVAVTSSIIDCEENTSTSTGSNAEKEIEKTSGMAGVEFDGHNEITPKNGKVLIIVRISGYR